MKKINLILLGFLTFTLIFVSCTSKDVEDEMERNELEIVEKTIQQDQRLPPPQITFRCINGCNDGSDCGMHKNVVENYIECTCSNCALSITTAGRELTDKERIKAFNNLERVWLPFNKFINKKYNTQDYFFTSIILNEYENNDPESSYDSVTVISLDYKIKDEKEGSIMYILEYDSSSNRVAPTIEVNCSGKCGSGSSQTCRERYYMATGIVECTCESDDCTMTVKDLEKEN